MEPVVVGLVAAVSALLVQGLGFYFNRKSGLAPAQEAYQDTLEGMNKALGTRVDELEKHVDVLTKQNERLTLRVGDLEQEVRTLTRENYALATQLLAAAKAEPKAD